MFIPQLRKDRLATGDRKLILDRQKPAWFRLFTQVRRTTCFDSVCPYLPSLRKLNIGGIPGNLHLFGTTAAKFNLLGTDEQGREFSRLLHGGRISLVSVL